MKRAILNAVLDATGITSYRWRRQPAGLYCFNFHRVGNDDGSAFHPNLYSCTGSRFAEIVAFLRSNFEMIGIDQVVQLVESGTVPDRRYGMISFDDGYVDGYEVAYQVLLRHGCPAVFFLPTDFIDGREVPWWDRIAWRVAQLGNGTLQVPGADQSIRITRADLKGSIRRVLRVVKDSPSVPMLEKVVAIETQVDCPDIRESGSRLFLSWDQVREMRRGGMWFGSHSRSHRILSHLSEAEQLAELSESKRILEAQIREPVDALAYPLGGLDTYTDFTKRAAKACGFKIAFNFHGGMNRDPAAHRYDIQRITIEGNMSVRLVRRAVAYALSS